MIDRIAQAHDLEEFTEGPNPSVCAFCLHPYHGSDRCQCGCVGDGDA